MNISDYIFAISILLSIIVGIKCRSKCCGKDCEFEMSKEEDDEDGKTLRSISIGRKSKTKSIKPATIVTI